MTIKKISLILLILTIMSLSVFKFSHPQLIPTGKIIIKEIQVNNQYQLGENNNYVNFKLQINH